MNDRIAIVIVKDRDSGEPESFEVTKPENGQFFFHTIYSINRMFFHSQKNFINICFCLNSTISLNPQKL